MIQSPVRTRRDNPARWFKAAERAMSEGVRICQLQGSGQWIATSGTATGIAYEVAAYPWAASGRAIAIGRTDGLTKWLVDPETERVLGCGIVGPGAGELVAEAVLALEMGCEVSDVTETIHPHPTLSETVMNAGEVFFGTATEIYKPKRRKAESACLFCVRPAAVIVASHPGHLRGPKFGA